MKILSLMCGVIADLEKGQYPLAFLFFIVGVTLFEAALDAVAFGLALLVLDAALFIDGQVAVGVGDGLAAFIAFYFA
jgi:hypothetical protein